MEAPKGQQQAESAAENGIITDSTSHCRINLRRPTPMAACASRSGPDTSLGANWGRAPQFSLGNNSACIRS
ncbi:MAG: hypothetical protein ACR2NN_21420 [Bryobacteraceae bacterium]